jgi:hypothetical protein
VRLDQRLQRVETSLTPKQAVLLWLKETLELGFRGFFEKILTSPSDQLPRARISQNVAKAVRETLTTQGMGPEVIARAVREAQKEADFLIVLIRGLQKDVQLTCELNAPYVVLLYEKLQRMREQIVRGSGFEPTAWGLWRGVLVRRLTEVWRLRETIKEISERYFEHHSLLFPEDERCLNEQICRLEELAEHCNTMQRSFARRARIDLKSLLSSIRKQVLFDVGESVAHAKSTTLEDFGEWEAARRVLEPYKAALVEKLRTARRLQGATS